MLCSGQQGVVLGKLVAGAGYVIEGVGLKPQNIVYLHGFASSWNAGSIKAQQLSCWTAVDGFDLDYCQPAATLIESALKQLALCRVDLLMGCSMGGWLAAELSAITGLPFVGLNPCVEPAVTLRKYLGAGRDYQGRDFYLTPEVVQSYRAFNMNACGLVLLDAGDEVLDAEHSHSWLQGRYPVSTFPGGSHRFDHIPQAIPVMQRWFGNC